MSRQLFSGGGAVVRGSLVLGGVLVCILLGNLSVDPALAQGAEDGDPSATSSDRERTVRVTRSGVVVQTVRVGDSTVTTYGPDAPVVTISSPRRAAASASIAITPSPRSKRRFDPTVFEMSMASGHFSRDEACDFARAIDPRGCVTSAQLRARSGGEMARSDFLDTRCWTFTHEPGDGTKYNYNCNYRRIDFKNTNLWLIANRLQATGWEENGGTCCDYLQGVGVRAEYEASDAHAVEWSPGETRAIEDSCRDITTSVTSARTGDSYSVSNEVCPEVLKPWHSPGFQYFGAKWTGPGAAHEDRRGALAASLVRVDRPGTKAYVLRAWLAWG